MPAYEITFRTDLPDDDDARKLGQTIIQVMPMVARVVAKKMGGSESRTIMVRVSSVLSEGSVVS